VIEYIEAQLHQVRRGARHVRSMTANGTSRTRSFGGFCADRSDLGSSPASEYMSQRTVDEIQFHVMEA